MSRRTTARVTLVAASVLMVAVAPLVACAAPPTSAVRASEPAPIPTTQSGSVSPSPSDVPTPTPTWPPQMALPTPPPEMSRADETGAIAAAEYLLALYRYTETTQNTAAWSTASHPSCVFCNSVRNDVTKRRAEGQVVIPAEITVHSADAVPLGPFAYSVGLEVSTGPDAVWTSDGSQLVSPGKSERGRVTAIVVSQNAGWLVREIDMAPAE